MNSSKKHDLRFWNKWHTAGAVCGVWTVHWPTSATSDDNLFHVIKYYESVKREIAEKLYDCKDSILVEGIFESHMNTPTHGGRIY